MFAAQLCSTEEVVLSSHRNTAQGTLKVVVIWRDIRFFQKDSHLLLVIAGVADSFGQWILGRQINALTLVLAPIKEGVDCRFCVKLAKRLFIRPCQCFIPNGSFCFIKIANESQRLPRRSRFRLF